MVDLFTDVTFSQGLHSTLFFINLQLIYHSCFSLLELILVTVHAFSMLTNKRNCSSPTMLIILIYLAIM